MKKLFILCFAVLTSVSAYSFKWFYNDIIVNKGNDYAFMKEDAKMWLYLDFTKALHVKFDGKAKKIKKEEGSYMEYKKDEWGEDFEKIYFWIVKYWNVACDHRNIALHMTADKDSAKYAMEWYIDKVDEGLPRIGMLFAGEGATLVGKLIVRDLKTKETVYEAVIDRVKTSFGMTTDIWRLRMVMYGSILAPHFLGMNPAYIDVGDKALTMKYDKDYKPKKK
ncbi:MAG: hypothetical protein J5542_11715 [Bacteroidales bacterium]|nr:hypothetical protein [Bacteroidales bacterium]